MAMMTVKFGGQIEAIEGSARAFGEANIDGPSLTAGDGDRLKEIVLLALQMVWAVGDYTSASVTADPSALIAALENQLGFGLLGDGATGKVTSITVVGGVEPAAPTVDVGFGGSVDLQDGKTGRLFGSLLVGGVDNLDLVKRLALEAAATMAAMGSLAGGAASAWGQLARTTRMGLRAEGFPTANVKVMFLQLVG